MVLEQFGRIQQRLWLIGGTRESVDLAHAIAQLQIPCIVTVTTASASSLYPTAAGLQVQVGQLSDATCAQWVRDRQITAILDASHPFAVSISKLAIAISAQFQIPYLRFERPSLAPDNSSTDSPGNLEFQAGSSLIAPSIERLVTSDLLQHQRVLLTVGYRPLHLFSSWQKRATLFARILPSETALSAALAAGFTPDRLIALRPPISTDLEKALWKQWQISMVVTKASGQTGGEDLKRAVAAELGIRLIAIARPLMVYPKQTSELSEAIQFCHQAFNL